MEIKSLDGIGYETVFKAFNEAFAEYEMQLNADELKSMLIRCGYKPELSFAAFEGEKIVAFTLNGTGDFNGLKTAYDTGTGTLKSHRGQGLAGKIFEHSIPYLQHAGISQYLLEVLQHNTAAVSVYEKAGFKITREFNYFSWNNEAVKAALGDTAGKFQIKPVTDLLPEKMTEFQDFEPSWQNSFQSVDRAQEDFVYLGAYDGEQLVGYCIFEPLSGDLTQIAVHKDLRRRGAGSLLLQEITKLNSNPRAKLINAEVNCTSILHFLKSKNIELTGKQYEMVKELQGFKHL
ncbi:MAG: GNAT family N-acetyltransferase [Weeksellaceae bacterium]|nr:GNAT family N-acetyltransferase [Bacteroidota bacterium]MCG2780676.1 GNAT family N-acetyltransferase [Weeksellaceae bacterium]